MHINQHTFPFQSASNTMNDFPVIGDLLCAPDYGIAKGKHCKSLQRNVWCGPGRGAVSPVFKSSVFGQRMPHFAVIL